MALTRELGRDGAQAQLAALGLLAGQPLRQRDDLRALLGVGLASLDLRAGIPALPLSRGLQLGDEGRLLELGDVAEDLADHDGGRRS